MSSRPITPGYSRIFFPCASEPKATVHVLHNNPIVPPTMRCWLLIATEVTIYRVLATAGLYQGLKPVQCQRSTTSRGACNVSQSRMLATSRLVDTKIRAKVAKSADTWMLVDLKRFRCGSKEGLSGRDFKWYYGLIGVGQSRAAWIILHAHAALQFNAIHLSPDLQYDKMNSSTLSVTMHDPLTRGILMIHDKLDCLIGLGNGPDETLFCSHCSSASGSQAPVLPRCNSWLCILKRPTPAPTVFPYDVHIVWLYGCMIFHKLDLMLPGSYQLWSKALPKAGKIGQWQWHAGVQWSSLAWAISVGICSWM